MLGHSDYFTEQQFTQFITAIKTGSIQQVEEIIRATHPSIVNTLDLQLKEPALYYATVHNNDETSQELMKILIRNGANIRFKDQNQQTVLFYVCREGKEKCAEILLSHGLNLDEVDVYGQTPLFYAVNQNRLGIVSKYSTKSRVNHPDTLAGQTPLYYAARKGHMEMTKCLIEKGADVTHADSNGKSAIEFAKKSKFHEVAQYLNGQYKRIKDVTKYSLPPSQSIDESNLDKRKKKEESQKNTKMTYKIVFLNDQGEPHDLTEEEVKIMMQEKPDLLSYLLRPDDIPAELLESSNNESWAKVANKIMAHVYKLKGSYWFAEPVDPIKYNITDYFDIITRPMDLGTIRKKLSHNCYANASEFSQDMSLVWQNCYRYNGEVHEISKCAKQLQNSFNECKVSFGLDKYLAGK